MIPNHGDLGKTPTIGMAPGDCNCHPGYHSKPIEKMNLSVRE